MKLGLVLMFSVVACGGNQESPVMHDAKVIAPVDGTVDGNEESCLVTSACSLLTQAGCCAGHKCTWVLSTDPTSTGPGLGAISCPPDGTVAIGGACTIRPAAMGGYDDCKGGGMCVDGICRAICDNSGGVPACGVDLACRTIDGVFANQGATTTPAGVCEPSCDPLDDNDFDGAGTVHMKTGTACGTDPLIGCYGYFSSTQTTYFQCEPAGTLANGETTSTFPPPNGNVCMSGYELGVASDATGSMTATCLAMCKPGEAYLGNPGTQQPNGVSPHGCNTTDATGTFGAIPNGSADSNGVHCMYSWNLEEDVQGHVHHSPTSDTVGICFDHTKYKYDPNNTGTPDTVLPPCAALPLTSTTTLSAADLGCVSTATAGLAIVAHPRPYIEGMPELHRR